MPPTDFAPDADFEPVRTRKQRMRKTVLSPVCEPIGDMVQPKHRTENAQIIADTALEVGSNY